MESPAIDARRCEGMGGNAAGCCTGAVLVVLVVLIELVVLIVLVVFGGLEAVFFARLPHWDGAQHTDV